MSKVLVVGAAGYIGFAIAQAFRRDGWNVYGIVRNEQQANEIRKKEIIPIVLNYKSASDFKPPHWTLDWSTIEVVIDATAGMDDTTFLEILRGYSKKTYIYCSGVLVYGHSEEVVDENTPSRPTALLKRRCDLEKQVLSDDKVNGIVMRPGWVFGGDGGKYISSFWNLENPIKGPEHIRWSWVHVEDVAQGFLLAAKHRHGNASKQIFNLTVDQSPTWKELRSKMSRTAGHKDELVFTGLTEADKGTWNEAMFQSVVASSKKAEDLLGWNPRFRKFLGDIDIYYQAYLASKK
jgi:nucleoside-diphosphate-sugar epimerase